MTLKATFVGCVTALLGLTGCASAPSQQDTERVLNKLPDYTTTDPKTGCRYIKDEKDPNKPQQCLPNEFPQRQMK